ncbi:nose resistant to fluoxetine protein 6-like [Daphnia carinata]|uniref:nose resistant to fluoxetine protein 6-like n=1 Tax=Daphnia carinata TaxID=120202 RepID=UPI002868401B|nr:nose resistant to fluoxetine protein 6-like [Daphnia carinata]
MAVAPLGFCDLSQTKGLFFYVFMAIWFNVQNICCQVLPMQPSTKNIPHQVFVDWLIQTSSPTALASNISEQCIHHTQYYLTALDRRQSWAVKMYESSGRLAEQLFHTNSHNVHHSSGLFDECLSIQPEDVPFQGQYCTVFFENESVREHENDHNYRSQDLLETGKTAVCKEGEPKEHKSNFVMPSVGFCLPSTCSARDLRSAVAQMVGKQLTNKMDFTMVAIANENYCYSQDKISTSRIHYDKLAMTVMIAFCLLIGLVLTATVHDNWSGTSSSCPDIAPQAFHIKLLHCFSAKRNCRMLFSTKDDVKDSLACLHGIRVITTCWIVLIHVAGEFSQRMSYTKQLDIKNASRWEFQIFTNGLFAVDTFFLMSGLLVAFTQTRQLDQHGGFFNIKRFYIRRFVRLTPVYASVQLFIATLWSYVGTGPDWNYVRQMSKSVRQNLWAHMLYINNYVAVIDQQSSLSNPLTGMIEAWYLACEMQMFWISPLFIYPLWRWRKGGLIWTMACFMFFLGFCMALFIAYDIPPTVFFNRPSDMQKLNEYCRKHYHLTIARIPPYVMGILLGWLLHKTKDRKIQINKFLVIAGWVMALLIGLLVIFGMMPYLDEAQIPVINPFVRISYGAFHRSSWAMVVAWLIFSCTHGYGGCINTLLSSKSLLPLSRLSYAVYLVHFAYVKAYVSHMRKPMYIAEYYFFTTYLGILMVSFMLASVISVIMEMPFMNLDKLLFPNSLEIKKTKKEDVNGLVTKNKYH